jgi:RNA polymerase sigma-70 factor, ECF subfamily
MAMIMISETRTDQESLTPNAPAGLKPASSFNSPASIDCSDVDTIQEVIGGDRQAFAKLAAKYQERLFNSLAYMLQDRSEAEDVVQEALTQSYLKLSTFRHEGAFYTWLYRIAWNIACTRRRRRRREVSLEQLCEASGTELAEAATVAPEDREDSVYRVRKALGDVSERFRTVLVLRHLEGHSYDTIADMLNLPVGTVRSRIHRGRTELRRKLELRLRPVQ